METTTAISPPRTLMEVFKSLPEGTFVQLIENELVMTPSPRFKHQMILNRINFELLKIVERRQHGTVLITPMDVYLDEYNAYQPDIMFISKDRKEIIRENGLHGAPDMVIELLSESTAKYGLNEKKDVYKRSGVLEYWIVNPENKEVRGYILKDDHYDDPQISKSVIKSDLLGTDIKF